MENAAEALKMAAAILVFIIALTSSFSLFGVAKQTADSIINMRDRQTYLDVAELDGGILYTSVAKIENKKEKGNPVDESKVAGVTKGGDRIVGIEDVISTISRYSTEKYAVTIVNKSGSVFARFDSTTDQIMNNYYRIDKDEYKDYVKKLEDHYTYSKYYTNGDYKKALFRDGRLENLYQVKDATNNITVGAPWYGNEKEIQTRIACELMGETYSNNNGYYTHEPTVSGGLLKELTKYDRIIEVINEIDNSKYLKQTDKNGNDMTDKNGDVIYSNLLQQYEMPTVEIVYLLHND